MNWKGIPYYRKEQHYYIICEKDLASRFNVTSLIIFVLMQILLFVLICICPVYNKIFQILRFIIKFKLSYNIFSFIFGVFSSYSFSKKLSIPRMKYKQIKQLYNIFPDLFEIGYIDIASSNNGYTIRKLLYIVYNNPDLDENVNYNKKYKEVCGDFISYIILRSAKYCYSLASLLEFFCSLFGIEYMANLKKKKEFDKNVKNNTELLIKDILKNIENLQMKNE